MSDMPWFQFFASDWLSGTRGLSAVETGIYITLIASMYDKAVPLENNTARLARLCGASPRQFKAACERLVEDDKILITEKGLWNARVDEQLQLRAAKSEKAKSSAETRWNGKTEQKQSSADANAKPKHCQTDAIQNQSQKEDEIGRGRDLALLERQLREAAGWEHEPAPMLCVVGPIDALLDVGCILELDVLPTVKALAPQVQSRTGWKYFLKAIAKARDDRLANLTAIFNPANPRPYHGKSTPNTKSTLQSVIDNLTAGHG